MKKNILHILIAILIISQVVSILKISSLQSQIENTQNAVNNLSSQIQNNINSIYSNVDEMLKKEASLIESAATEMGTLNKDELTVPITFTLTPKEVSEYTTVSLDFDGELFPMEKNGTTFFVTVSRYIFDNALPKIVIDESGVKKTMQDDQIGIWSIKESIFPTISPLFEGGSGYGGGIYDKHGTLSVDIKEVDSGIKFTKIRLVTKVDSKVISDEMIPNEALASGYEIDEEIPLRDGQICTMTVVATDSIGFEHHYLADHWVEGSDYSQTEAWYENEQIYSADGTLLWESEY